MELTESYEQGRSRLTVHVDGKRYVYKDVSPHHYDQFYKRRRNKGKAMAYICDFPLVPACPVCAQTNLDHDEFCTVCGWQEDSIVETPDRCRSGPNHAPLSVVRKRWEGGERDRLKLGACPNQRDEIGCFGCPYAANPDAGDNQETG